MQIDRYEEGSFFVTRKFKTMLEMILGVTHLTIAYHPVVCVTAKAGGV